MSSFETLVFGTVNVNSLMNKVHLVTNLLKLHAIDVLVVTESWLTSNVASSFVAVPGYTVVRGDTNSAAHKHGVCMYLSQRVKFVEVSLNSPNIAGVHLIDYNVYILGVYRPPKCETIVNDLLVEIIMQFCHNREAVVMGDFNLPSLTWSDGYANTRSAPPLEKSFVECFSTLGLIQWVHEGTFVPSGNTLDLILTSEPDRVGDVSLLAPFPHCGHCPVIAQYIFQSETKVNASNQPARTLWFKGQYNHISEALEAWDWDFEFCDTSVESDFSLLCGVLHDLCDRYIPVGLGRETPWSSKPPRHLMLQRSRAWDHYKYCRRTRGRNDDETRHALSIFQELNYQYRNFELLSRSNYESKLISRIKDAPKLFHSYIKHKKKDKPSVGPLKRSCGATVCDPANMAEMFASSFSSVFVARVPLDPSRPVVTQCKMNKMFFSVQDVEYLLAGLDGNSSMGPDNIHPLLLKACRQVLAYPLYLIFQKSLQSGELPYIWKCSSVVPLFKNGSRFNPLNYRPISLTSVCCKVLERLIVVHVMNYLESNNLLTPHQFGFRKGRCTEDQLLLTYSHVVFGLDVGLAVDVLLLDFSKAFDVVCHIVLLQLLTDTGFHPFLITWIRSFLSNREMRVKCDDVESSRKSVLSGVPQGSVLGPVLFLVYINNITSGISCEFKAFADDYKLYLRYPRSDSSSVIESVAAMQADLDLINTRAQSWNLSLNPDKCAVLRFYRGSFDWSSLGDAAVYSLNGTPIKIVTGHKDLGVFIDSKLRFHQHIHTIVNKASGLASNLLRSTVNRGAPFMTELFISHVRPLLDYCSSVYNVGYLGDSRLLESVQRRWTAAVHGLSHLNYGERLRSLNLFSLKGRRLRADLIKYWKVFHPVDSSDDSLRELFTLAPNVGTRGHVFKLSLPRVTTDLARRFFSVRCVVLWNSLPADVVQCNNLTKFKQLLAAHLCDKFFEYD